MKTIRYLTSQYPEFYESFVAREIEAVRRAGVDVRVFSLKSRPTGLSQHYPEHANLTVYSPFVLSLSLLMANIRALFLTPKCYLSAAVWLFRTHYRRPLELVKCLAVFPKTVFFAQGLTEKGAHFHVHWATVPASMGVVVFHLTGVRFTLTAHAWDIFLSSRGELRRKIAVASGVVTCTQSNVDYLRSCCQIEDRAKICRNYHGIDVRSLPGAAAPATKLGSHRLVAVGRLVEQKGFVHLVRALHLLADDPISRAGLRLQIVGEGPLRGELEKEAARLPPSISVELLGRLRHGDTLQRIADASVMVVPSVVARNGDRDGIPNVILEAMALGVPVVATRVSGIPEVVRDRVTGFLVDEESPSAIAVALKSVWAQPKEAADMGRRAKDFVMTNFDADRNAVEFMEILDRFRRDESRQQSSITTLTSPLQN